MTTQHDNVCEDCGNVGATAREGRYTARNSDGTITRGTRIVEVTCDRCNVYQQARDATWADTIEPRTTT